MSGRLSSRAAEAGDAPRVTVLLSVHDEADRIRGCLRSLVSQTYRDFEVLLLDDGSRDGTVEAAREVADGRLRVVQDGENHGLVRRLAQGVGLARGEYVARIDADETAAPDRLARQVAWLDSHPDVAVLGSPAWRVDESGRLLGLWPVPRGRAAVRFASLTRSPFVHGAVMIRRRAFADRGLGYEPAMAHCEDYDLFARVLEVLAGDNLSRPLLTTEVRQGVTARNRGIQLARADEVSLRALRRALPGSGIGPSEVRDLRELLVAPERPRAFDSAEAARIGALHLDLLGAFERVAGPFERRERRLLHADVALGLARASIRVRPGARWGRVLAQALRLDLSLPARAAADLILQAGPRLLPGAIAAPRPRC